jgi:hypothetical protein
MRPGSAKDSVYRSVQLVMGMPSGKAAEVPFDVEWRRTQLMAQEKCPNMSGCTMFPLLSLAGTLKTWQIRYCSGEFENCERYKRTLKGLPVAPDLMPNGVTLGNRKK